MSASEHDGPEKKEPPKIKLPGLDSVADQAAQADKAPPPPPPHVEATPSGGKTSRIELSQAVPPPSSALFNQTMRIDVPHAPEGGEGTPKRETTRIPLSDARRTESPDAALARKSQTTRIDVRQATPPPGESGIRETPPHDPSAALKRSTVRIDAGPARPPTDIVETVIPDAAKNVTQRILLDDEAAAAGAPGATPRDTTQIQEAKKRTSRIDLSEAAAKISQDALQRRVPGPAAAAPPVTSPAVEPPPGPGRPKTIRISKPPTGAPAAPMEVTQPPPSREIQEAKKSETARLDLPPDLVERPSTKPKTIRIKRPETVAARKPMAVSRTAAEPAAEPARAAAADAETDEENPGTLFTILSAAAVLVVIVVVYVLAAQLGNIGSGQFDLPSWPFAGRLPG
jgi:hypothetical protein